MSVPLVVGFIAVMTVLYRLVFHGVISGAALTVLGVVIGYLVGALSGFHKPEAIQIVAVSGAVLGALVSLVAPR